MDLLQGPLDLLILKAPALGLMHGYGVSVRLGPLSKDGLAVQLGSTRLLSPVAGVAAAIPASAAVALDPASTLRQD